MTRWFMMEECKRMSEDTTEARRTDNYFIAFRQAAIIRPSIKQSVIVMEQFVEKTQLKHRRLVSVLLG